MAADELSGSDQTLLPAGSEVVALTTEPELDFFHQIERAYRNLGVGELGAITVAKFRSIFVSNDGNARAAAKDLGLELTGGLGLLQLGVSLGHIQGPDGIRIMEEMVLNEAWFSDELIKLFRQSVLKNYLTFPKREPATFSEPSNPASAFTVNRRLPSHQSRPLSDKRYWLGAFDLR